MGNIVLYQETTTRTACTLTRGEAIDLLMNHCSDTCSREELETFSEQQLADRVDEHVYAGNLSEVVVDMLADSTDTREDSDGVRVIVE